MIEVDCKKPRIKGDKELKKLWKQAEPIEEPSWQEYLKGIKRWEEKLTPNPAWETDLRMLTWRRYNDEYREKLERQNKSWRQFFSKGNECKKWIDVPHIPAMMENCNNVASRLYEGNPDTAMDKADILRWLGRYELAIQLLETLLDLQEFDEVYHTKRYEKLLEMSQDRKSALEIVSDD